MAPKVLVVCGSSRIDGRLRHICSLAADSARAAGAEVRELNLDQTQLPVMVWGEDAQSALPEVALVRESAAWAEGFILATPEYHGSMSGALKNWFDFLYPELAGKFAGVLASTGGGTGDMSTTAVKTCFQWCHGFVLPFHAAATTADFDGEVLREAKVIERIQRIGRDVARYAPVLRAAFTEAQSAAGVEAGFAGLH